MGLIQRLLGNVEAEEAQERAAKSLEAAKARTTEISLLTGRVQHHGYVNHLGERVELAWKGGA